MAIAETPTRPIAAPQARPTASRRLTEHQIGRLLVLPALIFAILVTQAPFLLTIWYSLQRWNLNRPERRAFVGLDNYVFLLTRDPAFLEAILNTVVFVVGAVVASLALGLLYAELVNHRFPGRGIVRTMLITPFLIMPAAAALTWKNQLLNPNYGVVDWAVNTALPGNPGPSWLDEFPMFSVIAVIVWRWAPFMMLILLAGMQSISEEVREAARVDGATARQEFFDITLPQLWRFMQLGGLLGTVFIVQEIDPIFMMTGGGPGDATTTLPYLVYEKARESFDIGRGAALGVIVVLISMVAITFLVRVLDRMLGTARGIDHGNTRFTTQAVGQRDSRRSRILEGNRLTALGNHRLDRGADRLFPGALHVPDRVQDRERGGGAAAEADLLADVRELRSGVWHQLSAVLSQLDHHVACLDIFRHAARDPLRICLGALSPKEMERHPVLLHLDAIPAGRRSDRAALRHLQPQR